MSDPVSNEITISRLREGVVENISLYVALEPGTKADLEVIARASLEFAATLREVAYVIDPSIELRIEIESGTPGSLSLNSVLRFLKVRDRKGRLNIKAIALGVGAFFFHEASVWKYNKILDHAFTPEEKAQFTQAEMEEIARKTADAIQRRVGSSQAERVYRELQADPAISGVTVTRGVEASVQPSSIVPKTEFVARSGSLRQEIENGSKRTRDELTTLELISPVLALDTKRQWRFRGASGDFGAEMNDERFLVDLVQGKTAVTMSSGIFLDVELRTVEEKKAGVWQVKSRSILQVRQIRLPPSQTSLNLPRRPG